MNKLCLTLAVSSLCLFDPSRAIATERLAWNNHAAPFTFRFGNELDNHQSSRVSSGALFGLLYIQFAGTTTRDGYRVASHGDCSLGSCTAGWVFDGKPLSATFVGEPPHDHPQFLVARPDIPQPGAFSHFHWLGDMPASGATTAGYLLQLVAVERFCFIHDGASAATSDKSCRDNGGVALSPGLDVASHLNILTSLPPDGM